MHRVIVVGLAASLLLLAPGCGGDDDGGGGSGGGATGGAGGAAGGTGGSTGGDGGVAGSAGSSGSGGVAGSGGSTGGTGGATGGAGGGSGFWPNPYDAACTPTKESPSWHTSTQAECLHCHKSGGWAPAWLFGGIVYQSGGTKGAQHVEVGVSDGTNFVYACSDSKGLYYAPVAGNPAINWANAKPRIRDANGEKKMASVPQGTCLACHVSNKLIQP